MMFSSKKIRISSTKSKWEMVHIVLTTIYFNRPLTRESFNILLRDFETKRERMGKSGNPYIIPLSTLRNRVVEPFISRKREIVLMQFMIQFTKEWSNPKSISSNMI